MGEKEEIQIPPTFSLPFLFHIPLRRNEGILKAKAEVENCGEGGYIS